MKIYNIIRFDSDGQGGEKSRVLLTFADRSKAEERVVHLYEQHNPGRLDREVDHFGLATWVHELYPTFHVISKTLLGWKTLARHIKKGRIGNRKVITNKVTT